MEHNTIDSVRRWNWLAITLATVVMAFSYFSFAAAFVSTDEDPSSISPQLVALALALAPLVFVILGFLSHNPQSPRLVLRAMGLLVAVGLAVGLVAPVLGAAAGFGTGGAVVLNRPPVDGVVLTRTVAVVVTVVYVLALLVLITPAGVFTGALLPLFMIGFADEYAIWRADDLSGSGE